MSSHTACIMVHRAPTSLSIQPSDLFSHSQATVQSAPAILTSALLFTHSGVAQDQSPGCSLNLDHALNIFMSFSLSPPRGGQILLYWPKTVVSPVLTTGLFWANQAVITTAQSEVIVSVNASVNIYVNNYYNWVCDILIYFYSFVF